MQSNTNTNVILSVIALALVVPIVLFFVHKNAMAPVVSGAPTTTVATTTDMTTTASGGGNQVPVSPSSSAANASPTAVAGMQEYTDTNLGYSFWYPATWNLNTNASGGISALSGGVVTQTLAVGSAGNMSDGITLQDFVSNGLSITDSSNCGPVDGCYAVKYYFNPTVHEWMKEVYATSTSSGVNAVADISVNTMGGLHIFPGNMRFQNDVIIPLSGTHFVVVSGTSAGGILETPLANTIVATDPSVATPVSTALQTQAIQAEMTAYANEQSNTPNPAPSVGWQTYTDPLTGMSLQYPTLGSTSLQPTIAATPASSIDTQGCLPGELENGHASPDVMMTINGINFCHSESTDSGMSHYGDVNYYTFSHNGTYYTVTYDVSTVDCGVYGASGDPQYDACETNNSSIGTLTAYIQQSLATLVP